MNGHVGGRVELVAPRAVTDSADRWRLLALVALSVAVHGWLIANTAVTAKDSTRFARHALALGKPNQDRPADALRTLPDVLRDEKDPPGYPLALAALYVPTKALRPDATVMERALLAGQLASALAAVLTVFPMYWLGRMLFAKWVGFAATAIFQCLPVYARESSDAISDGLYLFFVATFLLLAARGIRRPSVGKFLLSGLAIGLAYLVRPEGLLLLFPAAAAVMIGMWWFGHWPRRSTAAWLTALAVGTAIPVAPYVATIGRLTNKPTVREMLDPNALPGGPRANFLKGQGAAPPAPVPAQPAPNPAPNGNPGPIPGQPAPNAPGQNPAPGQDPAQPAPKAGAAVAGPPFASWVPADAAGAGRVGLAVWEAGKEWLKATHYSVGVLAVIGLVLLRGRFRTEPGLWLLVVFGGGMAAAMVGLAEFRGYVSERHALPATMALVFFAVAGLEPLFAWAYRNALFWNGLFRWPPLIGLVCAAVMLSGTRQLARPLHDNRLGHKLAADAIREQLQQGRWTEVLADPYGWVRFLSGWSVYNDGPDDPAWTADKPLVRWAVIELTEKDGVVQPDTPKMPDDDRGRYDLAHEIYHNTQGGTVERVFAWPDPSTGERPRVVVVKQTLPPMPKK